MKPIKITVENTAAIEAALKAVNGKAEAHTYTSAYSIFAMADRFDARLDKLGLPKGMRSGARYISQSGSILPAAYKNTAITTRVVIERRSNAFWLIAIEPDRLYPKSKPFVGMILTEAQDAKAIEVLRQGYCVI
jgi:hypothetical protein